ncbi:MAG: hypothetical protein QXP36_14070, partial [Conexivisphaerales archaeon]
EENTVFALQPGRYTYIHFELDPGNYTLSGSLTSSTYVWVYLLNASQFKDLSRGMKFNYVYYTFADSGASIEVALHGGNYYLVFLNLNKDWGVGVEITSNIVITDK